MLTKIIYTICILAHILIITLEAQLFNLVLTSQERGAACLDGSPTGFYFHQGLGSNKNNFLVYFQGGGFCGQSTLAGTLENCYKRSFTVRGSSKVRPTFFNTTGFGFLSTLQSENPYFYDWTKVIVMYCDGHQYAGHRQSPIQYKDRKLYFRGSRNVKQIFYNLNQNYGLYDGDKIVISGGSAGGICAFEWSNYLFENSRKAKVYAMPDSGFFITDYQSPLVGKKILREITSPLFNMVYNQTEMPQPIVKCVKQPGFDIVDCFNVANYAQHLKAPLFMIQSPYDQWSLQNIVAASCLTNKDQPYSLESCNKTVRDAIDDYRLKSISYLKQMKRWVKSIGVWGPACVQHCYAHEQSYNSTKYEVNGFTLMEAINNFLNNPEKAPWLLDEKPWPENIGCSGLNSVNLKIVSDK